MKIGIICLALILLISLSACDVQTSTSPTGRATIAKALSPASPQAVYYVDPNGSDETGDGSAEYPWRTIQHAASQVFAGDTVLINPGTYEGGITVDVAGTESAPITFQASGQGVVVQGSGGERDAFFITEANYVVVEGLTIQGAERAGLRISWSNHVTVHGCTFADNGTWGVFTDFSDYTLVESCETYGAVDEHGIYISNSSDYPTIRGNLIHHNYANGLHMNGDASMGGDGVISYGLIEGNVIYENGQGGGSGINMDGVTDTIVRNNLLYDNHASGISVYQIDGGSGSQRNRLLNNTIVMPDDGRWAINIPETVDTHNQVFNNIIYSHHSWRGSILIAEPTLTGFESDYNIVMSRFSTDGGDSTIDLSAWQALGYDTHSIVATPDQLFVDPAAGDYHLVEGCEAIDHGTSLPDVLVDLEGNPRPSGLAYDIGAYEFVSGEAGNRAPYEPSNPVPADGATNVPLDQILTWQGGDPDGDPLSYTVAFGAVSPPPVVTVTAQTVYTPATLVGSTLYPGLITDTTYYWRITATDGLSVSLGPLWQFATAAGAPITHTAYLPVVIRQGVSSPPGHPPKIAGCDVFPADNIWNTPVDALPLDPNSDAYVATIGAGVGLHADFGSGTWAGGPIGIPYVDVPGTQPRVAVTFDYDDESDPGPYPIPPDAPIEGGLDSDGDRHVLVLDRDACVLYELFYAWPQTDGSWQAGSGAVFDLNSHALRPDGWTSADAAGLPILPGLVRYDEVASGEVRHAARFTAPQTRRAYVWPARHYASSLTGQEYPPMGQRFRLKADFDISGFSPQVQVILQAFKTYGIILADNGSAWYISGVPDERWDNDLLRELRQVHGSDFEAVDVSSLMVDPDSGQVGGQGD